MNWNKPQELDSALGRVLFRFSWAQAYYDIEIRDFLQGISLWAPKCPQQTGVSGPTRVMFHPRELTPLMSLDCKVIYRIRFPQLSQKFADGLLGAPQ